MDKIAPQNVSKVEGDTADEQYASHTADDRKERTHDTEQIIGHSQLLFLHLFSIGRVIAIFAAAVMLAIRRKAGGKRMIKLSARICRSEERRVGKECRSRWS